MVHDGAVVVVNVLSWNENWHHVTCQGDTPQKRSQEQTALLCMPHHHGLLSPLVGHARGDSKYALSEPTVPCEMLQLALPTHSCP